MSKINCSDLKADFEVRAHHGLCIRFFENKGYSDDFSANMAKVIGKLSKNPDVKIVKKADVICSKCPNNQSGVCKDLPKVNGYDSEVLAFCGLQSGDVLPWNSFQKIIFERILNVNKFSAVCSDCCWAEICHK